MNCCSECFIDKELKALISNNYSEIGNCDYCKSKNTKIIDPRELSELFQPLVETYIVDVHSDKTLNAKIQEDWKLFNLDNKKSSQLILDIFADELVGKDSIFNKNVINKKDISTDSDIIFKHWIELKEEIKTSNRFFLQKLFELELLEELLVDREIQYKKGKLFYRARISTEKGFEPKEMGKPPADKATPGRANPKGIPYLYVCTDKLTTLYESRANYLDYVTIGEFELLEDINIIQLRSIEFIGKKSPFQIRNLDKIIRYHNFLVELEKELSKPLRRFDSELDYLPTQYLCEFVKSQGYDGVEFGSAMKRGGINLAIFDDSKFNCNNTEIIEIKNIDISI